MNADQLLLGTPYLFMCVRCSVSVSELLFILSRLETSIAISSLVAEFLWFNAASGSAVERGYVEFLFRSARLSAPPPVGSNEFFHLNPSIRHGLHAQFSTVVSDTGT